MNHSGDRMGATGKSNRRRNRQILFRVTEQERDLIRQKMEQAGIRNMEAYLRKMALDGLIIHLDLSDVRDMVSLLRRCSLNLNQIVRRANETRSIYAEDLTDLQSRYDQLWGAAREILLKLAKI